MKKDIRMAILAIAFFLFIGVDIAQVYGETCSIVIDTDKDEYSLSERVFVYGTVGQGCQSREWTDYACEIRENDRIFFADQRKTDSYGNFFLSFVTGDEPASYTITVSTREASGSADVETSEQEEGIAVETDKEVYIKGETVRIYGEVIGFDELGSVAVIVKDDAGKIVFLDEAVPEDDGSFSSSFKVTPDMKTGRYRVFAAHEEYVGEAELVIYQGIVINEVMFYPAGGDTDDEFVEIFNPTERLIDISGWRISDGAGNTETVGNGVVLEPGDFAVFAVSQDIVDGDAGFIDAGESVLGGLPDTRGRIILYDADGNKIDSFLYRGELCDNDDGDGGPDCAGGGASLERIDAYGLTDLYSNWEPGVYSGTPGDHNSVSVDGETDGFDVLFVDMASFADAGEEVSVMLRVRNDDEKYRLFETEYQIDDSYLGHSAVVVGPHEYADAEFSFIAIGSERRVVSGNTYASGYEDEGHNWMRDIEIFDSSVEGFSADILAPALVPRGGEFEAVAVVINELEDDILDVNIEIGVQEGSGLGIIGDSSAGIGVLNAGSSDSSVMFRLGTDSLMDDEMLGQRIISLHASGIADAVLIDDASFAVAEIIGHSSPVVSADASMPERIDTGRTYKVIFAVFNTGTEDAKNVVVTLFGDGIEVVSEDALFFDKIESGDVKFFEARILAQDERETYSLTAKIKDDTGSVFELSQTARGTASDTADAGSSPETADLGSRGDGSQAGFDIDYESTGADDDGMPEDAEISESFADVENDGNIVPGEEDDSDGVRQDENIAESRDAGTASPTGRIAGAYGTGFGYAIVIIIILIAAWKAAPAISRIAKGSRLK